MKATVKMLRLCGGLTLAATLLAGCLQGPAPDQLNVTDPNHGFERLSRSYSSMDHRFTRAGLHVTPKHMAGITLGQSREAVEAHLGKPYRTHGDAAWEYNLSLPLTRKDRLICQYMVHFDEDDKVVGTVWRRPQCTDLALGRQS